MCHSQQQLSEVSSLCTPWGSQGSYHVIRLGSKHFCPLGHVISLLEGSLYRLPLEPRANLLAFCDLTPLSPFAHCNFGLCLSTPGCGFPDKTVLVLRGISAVPFGPSTAATSYVGCVTAHPVPSSAVFSAASFPVPGCCRSCTTLSVGGDYCTIGRYQKLT